MVYFRTSVLIIMFLDILNISNSDAVCSVLNSCYEEWESWGSCSSSCGGGSRSRTGYLCCEYNVMDTFIYTETCNQLCYNGGSFVESCRCTDIFYGPCCSSPCPDITNCKRRYCSTATDTRCRECNDDNIFYKRTNSDTRCERMCSWNGHYCWPGVCSNELTSGCQCATDFTQISTSSETSCQPAKRPTIVTCNTELASGNGVKMAFSNSTKCQFLADVFGNFQPILLQYEMIAEYKVDVSSYIKPKFVHDFNFGVTDTRIIITLIKVNGESKNLSYHGLLNDTSSSTLAVPTDFKSGHISLSSPVYALADGQRLCITFEAYGGGYLKSRNFITSDVLSTVAYNKVASSRQVCYKFDSTPPEHCMARQTCHIEPLQIYNRVTRSFEQSIGLSGWIDPTPVGGNTKHASSIKSYNVIVQEVLPIPGKPSKISNYIKFTKRVDTSESNYLIVNLNLISDGPRLYCIGLEVLDYADNVRRARRFLLFDNLSVISVSEDAPVLVTSASRESNFTWQTHHSDICVSWEGHFRNQYYKENELLNPIESDPTGLISGIYEQNSGKLPVYGTDHVNGITNFFVSWQIDNYSFNKEIEIQNIASQSACFKISLTDGQSCSIRIRAVDVMENTGSETTKVYIDSSPPIIDALEFLTNGNESLLLNESINLFESDIYFEAIDLHSGISSVEWNIREPDSDKNLVSGSVQKETCHEEYAYCYCPSIGLCESYNYSISLLVLKDVHGKLGGTQRNYTCEITVTNNAQLVTVKQVVILVDAFSKPAQAGPVAAIVGGVVGGLVVLISAALALFLIRRRRENKASSHAHVNKSTELPEICKDTIETNINSSSNNCTRSPEKLHAEKAFSRLRNWKQLFSAKDCQKDSDGTCYDNPSFKNYADNPRYEGISARGDDYSDHLYENLKLTARPFRKAST